MRGEPGLVLFEVGKGLLFVLVAGALNYFLLVRHGERVLRSEIEATRELAESQAYIRGVLDSLPVETVIVDSNGAVMMHSRSWSDAHQSALVTIHDGPGDGGRIFPEEVQRRLDELLSGSEHGFAVEIVQTSGDGKERHYLVQGSTLSSGERGAVLNFVEVTERQHLRERLDELVRLESLGKIAGVVAHEFNNVLMGIGPSAEVLRKIFTGTELGDNAIRNISQSVSRGQRITSEILRFAHPEKPTGATCGVVELTMEVERACIPLLPESQHLIIEKPDRDHRILIECSQMVQVIANLVLNASHAMERGGDISISSEFPDSSKRELGLTESGQNLAHFRVRDEGSGIPPENLERIFEPMFTTRRAGTGLGLALARRIMESHGGSICAESSVSSGTTMHLFIPFSEAPEAQPRSVPAAPGR